MSDNENNKSYFFGEHAEYYGDKWAAFSKDGTEFFKKVITTMYDDDNTEIFYFKEINHIQYLGLLCEKNSPVSFLIIFEVGKNKKTNDLLSAYPVLKGCSNNIILKEKYAWPIEAEGEMACITEKNENIILNFHNPFFAVNIDDFKIDDIKTISLAGLAYSITQLQEYQFEIKEGSFYDFALKEFLKENPDKTEKDFDTPSISINPETFRMIKATKYTSEYSISGIIKNISDIVVLDEPVKIFKVDIGHEENNEPLFINIYASYHVCKNYTFKTGDNITANIWLTGYFEK